LSGIEVSGVKSVAYILAIFGYISAETAVMGVKFEMRKTYSVYEAATGLFTGQLLHCDDEELLSVRLPTGTLAREGKFDRRCQRVDLATGAVVPYRPPAPSGDEGWNKAEVRWQLDLARSGEDRAAKIHAHIHMLELSQGRAVREATLGDETAIMRLKEIDTEIRNLRKELARV